MKTSELKNFLLQKIIRFYYKIIINMPLAFHRAVTGLRGCEIFVLFDCVIRSIPVHVYVSPLQKE